MTITATVVADSISSAGARLTTLQLRYPRFVHAEFMTHRVFSRNASSSRAIPVERLIADVERDPAMPIFWGKNQAGMQAREEHNEPVKWARLDGSNYHSEDSTFYPLTREQTWGYAMGDAIDAARALTRAGYHKQIVNRLLEPFSHINVVVTATEWDNFIALRCHPDAQPEMRALAEAMRDARAASTPVILRPGDWHIPYLVPADVKTVAKLADVDYSDWRLPTNECSGHVSTVMWPVFVKLSVARCARVSYLTHDGKEPSVEADLALYERLASAVPMHASPMEHQATPDHMSRNHLNAHEEWDQPWLHGNLVGWCQYRKTVERKAPW